MVSSVAEWSSALESSSAVFGKQSVGSSPGRGTCVLKKDTLLLLLQPSDGTDV